MPRLPGMTTRARILRNAATEEERILWRLLHAQHPRFTRQFPVDRFVLDFACRSARLGVEIDGTQHVLAPARDELRTRALEALGWRVIRFANSEVQENPEGVAEAMLAAARERVPVRSS